MEGTVERLEIPYHEYRVIAHLLRAHVDEHGGRLKAMIAFGDQVVGGATYDIDLLEVVEGWEGKRYSEFSRSRHLPLRGTLRLYFLTPEVFENPSLIEDPDERQWVQSLLNRVRAAYEVIMDAPPGWVRGVLEPLAGVYSSLTAPPSGAVVFGDPYRLTRKGE